MIQLWFTEKDIRYRHGEVKRYFWEELEDQARVLCKRILEGALRVERSGMIGAGHYERCGSRLDHSNGYYVRDVICKLGVLSKVLVPRSRRGVYRSEIIERFKRFGGSFDRYILRLATLKVSTRDVSQFFGEFFGELGFGAQTVSSILRGVDAEVRAYHQRVLSDDVRYLYLDGISVPIRSGFKRQQVVLCALAEYTDGRREIIDFQVASSEKGIYWQAFLEGLYRRGLTGHHLQLIVIDGAGGLLEAVRTVYGFVPVQVCWIHRQRNLIKRLTHGSHRGAICAEVSAIFQADSRQTAVARIKRFRDRWRLKEPKAVKCFLQDIDLSLTFYDQPPERWKQLASNNIIERQLREIRKKVRLIDSFRDEKSCGRIIYTQVKERNKKMELNP